MNVSLPEPTPLVCRIRDEIRSRGVLSFARYMEIALYDPEWGYYESGREIIGRRGDYLTSVSVGSVFGELLAHQIGHWLAGIPGEAAVIVEAGAHDGELAADILAGLRTWQRDRFSSLQYWILEPSARRVARQRERLAEFGSTVCWYEDWGAAGSRQVSGVILSNELLDAFPVHRFGWDRSRRVWFEWGIGWEDGEGLVWRRMAPGVDPGWVLQEAVLDVLPDGYVVESCPAATGWWRQAAGHLACGWLLTFDYGGESDVLFRPERTGGTLRAYAGHRCRDVELSAAGEQDLTAHVNFSRIREAGEAAGLQTEAYTSQEQFLMRIAGKTFEQPDRFPEWTAARRRQLQTLVHAEHWGRAFRVLVQRRVAGSMDAVGGRR